MKKAILNSSINKSRDVASLKNRFSLLICLFVLTACNSGTTTKPATGNSNALSGTPPIANSHLVFSPYMYSGDYANSSNQLTTGVTGVVEPVLTAMPKGLSTLTWAFATGTCAHETWSGVSAAAFASANVQSFVGAGKKYIVSTGGAGNSFFCASNADFLTFINTYYSANMLGVDFDIENGQTQNDVNNLVAVAAAAQTTYPNLRFSFTIGFYGGQEAFAARWDTLGNWIMAAINTYGLKNYMFNLMTMDYAATGTATSYVCTLQPGTSLCDMGQSAVVAAQNLHISLGVPYNHIELTPLIGGNDDHDEIFTLADASTISSFALANGIAGIHFWAFSRDNDCPPTTNVSGTSDRCNNYGHAGTLGYTNAFLTNLGL